MRKVIRSLPTPERYLQRLYSSRANTHIHDVPSLRGPIDSIEIEEFRRRAFSPELPILISRKYDTNLDLPYAGISGLPATAKWFKSFDRDTSLSYHYLSTFGTTILPYEFIVDSSRAPTYTVDNEISYRSPGEDALGVSKLLDHLSEDSAEGAFHRFNAPLSLFLEACKLKSAPRLYIAQAQIADLPKELQEDLPIPRLVKEAGKGDIYDSNIWMGIPPTYTPLHKDPNPNLFIQLASTKVVRLFEPIVGAAMYRGVQQSIGQANSASFRGEEMMEGPEREDLEKSTWSREMKAEGYEAVVSPGDALFIPKGWWHSIKSIGTGVTASVNWWFR